MTWQEELRLLLEQAFHGLALDDQVAVLNEIRRTVADYSPFNAEPVDLVEWIPSDDVQANDYNPNSVAPPEMELLRVSIMADGYTTHCDQRR